MVQVPLFRPQSSWTPPCLADLPSWKGAARVSLDTETHDPALKDTGIGVRRDGRVVGISFAIEGDLHAFDETAKTRAFYLPIGHEGGGNLDPKMVLAYLADQAREFRGELVGANLPYDLDYLLELGIAFSPSWYRDVLLAEPILDPLQFSYALGAVLERNGLPGKDEELLEQAAAAFGFAKKVKQNIHRLPASLIGPYAEADAALPLRLLRLQEERIREEDRTDARGSSLWSAWDLESRLLPVLVKMRRRGVRIDNDQLDRVEARAVRIQEDALAELTRVSGMKITRADVNKARLVGAVIEKATGRKLPLTQTGPCIRKDVLDAIDHPVVRLYQKAKRYDKLRTTYIKGLREHQVKGRIHCTFNQAKRESDDGSGDSGTITYRLSAVDPSMQNQPIRDKEIGKEWRACYLPDEGAEWACLDYCYDPETEILTQRGWIKFPLLQPRDLVAQWDAGRVSYVKPLGYYRSEYKHDLITIRGDRQVDLAVTYNHDCVLLGPNGLPYKVKATEYAGQCENRIQPQNGRLDSSGEVLPDVLRLVAAVQADASDRGTSYRFWLKRTRKIERLQMILRALGVSFTTGQSKAKGGQTYFTVPKDERLTDFLLPGKEFRRDALLSLTPQLRRDFLLELQHWDGRPANQDYFSTHIQNCQTVQELAVLTGFRSNLILTETSSGRPFGTVSLNEKSGTLIKTLDVGNAPSTGLVYCVTVPSGAIMIRRNGRVSVSGNSQQEPRWLLHFAEKSNCPGAHKAAEACRTDPKWDYHTTNRDMIGWEGSEGRDKAKTIGLGLAYRMGGPKLCRSLSLPTKWIKTSSGRDVEVAGEEGQRILNDFNTRAPFIEDLMSRVEATAKERGYVRTIVGHRVRFPKAEGGRPGYDWVYAAGNHLIQGSSAGQTKKAMVDADDAGIDMQLQVHDELNKSVSDRQVADHLAEIMRVAVPCNVPHKVEPKFGKNWGECK